MRGFYVGTLVGFLAVPVLGWSMDVHNQIGFVTDELLTQETKEILGQILEPETEGKLGRVSAWADEYRATPEGGYTTPWHWVNSGDLPPSHCSTHVNRDCTKNGCIINAIANQTEILKECIRNVKLGKLNDTGTQCADAVKLIAHLNQDITQPMHVTGLAQGGNGYPVNFGNVSTNLHAVWDGYIVYTLARNGSFADIDFDDVFPEDEMDPFFANMVERIRADSFFIPTSKWIKCADPGTPRLCSEEWARDSNEWNCDYAFSQQFNQTDLLANGYAHGAWAIAEVQMAKAALRTATWFNRLVENCFHGREVILDLYPSWIGGPNAGK